MATVRVHHSVGDLADDLRAAAVIVKKGGPRIVRTNVREGREQAQLYARRASGPHGVLYFKRITDEMTGPLEGEFGPHGDVVGNAVGGGWRSGPVNTDLDRAADVIGHQFADDAADLLDEAFWP